MKKKIIIIKHYQLLYFNIDTNEVIEVDKSEQKENKS